MEPPEQAPSGEVYRAKRQGRRRRRHRRLIKPRHIAMAMFALAIFGAAGASYYLYHRRPIYAQSDAARKAREARDRQSLVTTVNQMLSQTGKDVPPSDLVLGVATLRTREGKVYLDGTLVNRSAHPYPRVHLIFDAMDKGHNPAGLAEGDVTGVQAERETAFELGPVSSEARTCVLRSISLVQ